MRTICFPYADYPDYSKLEEYSPQAESVRKQADDDERDGESDTQVRTRGHHQKEQQIF